MSFASLEKEMRRYGLCLDESRGHQYMPTYPSSHLKIRAFPIYGMAVIPMPVLLNGEVMDVWRGVEEAKDLQVMVVCVATALRARILGITFEYYPSPSLRYLDVDSIQIGHSQNYYDSTKLVSGLVVEFELAFDPEFTKYEPHALTFPT